MTNQITRQTLERLLQFGNQPRPDLLQAVNEYHREMATITSSFLPRDLRRLAGALARAKMEENLKDYFLD